MNNYFKLNGPGLGRPGDCYTFNSEAERTAAFAAVLMAKEQSMANRGPSRIVIWKRSSHHPDLKVVGDCPEDPSEFPAEFSHLLPPGDDE